MDKLAEIYSLFHDDEMPEDYYDMHEDAVDFISDEDLELLKVFHNAVKPAGYHAPLSHRKKTFEEFISCNIDSYIELAEMYSRHNNQQESEQY